MITTKTQHSIHNLFALLAFALFAVALLMTLSLCVQVYQSISQQTAAAYDQRTLLQYIGAKVRHGDQANRVYVADYGPQGEGAELPTLYLEEEINGALYQTRIYFYQGYVRELMTPAGLDLPPNAGNIILQAESLSFSQEGSLLTIQCRDGSGEAGALSLCLRSAAGEGEAS